VTTRLSSCARLGLARLLTIVVVCGVAVLILPSPAEGATAVEILDPWMSAAPADAPVRSDAMSSGASLSDPDQSDEEDDDDDDDAAPDAPAAAVPGSWAMPVYGESALIAHDPVRRPIRPLDGQSLRGPPCGSQEPVSADFDNANDNDSSTSARRGIGVLPSRPPGRTPSHSEPARRRVPDWPQLRAP
jgi:hypothetical protein